MKIKSDFKDYYDYAMAHGEDKEIVFERETSVVKKDGPVLEKIKWEKPFAFSFFLPSQDKDLALIFKNRKIPIDYAWVSIGEKIYPVYHIPDTNIFGATMERAFEKLNSEVLDLKKIMVSAPFWLKNLLPLPQNKWEKEGFKKEQKEFQQEWLEKQKFLESINWSLVYHELNSPVVLISSNFVLTKNPCLKDLDFAEILPAYEVFQMISDTISGVLTQPTPDMIEIDDQSMVKKKGFDPEYGFRKRRQK